MKNVSIRTRILGGIVLVNLLGALVVMVYLHQSFSGGLDVASKKSMSVSLSVWNDVTSHTGKPIDFASLYKDGGSYLERMKQVTGSEYGLLLDKAATDAQSYEKLRSAANLPNDWDERENSVLSAVTDRGLADRMTIGVDSGSIPEIGKMIGIENGACSKTCHAGVKGKGDFWGVSWSDDSRSRAHAVFPVADAAGKPLGLVYSIEDISAQADADKGSLYRTFFMIITTLLIATAVIGYMLDALVFKRLNHMIMSMEDLSIRVAGGDFGAHFETDGTTDEIGRFQQFFAKFLDLMSSTLDALLKK
ncbi:MAG: hypothetical protein WC971_08450 [Coriobacteriia bacterium]